MKTLAAMVILGIPIAILVLMFRDGRRSKTSPVEPGPREVSAPGADQSSPR